MGLCLRRRVLQYSWRGGRFQPESMAAFNRNQWQPSTGIGGRFRPESVAIFARNTQVIAHAPRIGINSIVLGELLSGFAVGTREAENRQELEQFLASERVHHLVIDAATAAQYAGVYRELRRRGRPILTNDMWIAASALQHGFAVFSDDGHFHEVSGLQVGMRLDDFLF